MDVVIIGSGNVATVLGKKIKAAGHDILQVAGRNEQTCAELAVLLNCEFTINWNFINRHADLYIVAVSDAALPALHEQLQLDKKLVVHTAGAVTKEVLQKVSVNYGVLYPLQSLRKAKEPLPEIPFLVDANSYDAIALLKEFAETIATNVQVADDDARKKIHLAAVLVNNFTNHLYALADKYCAGEHLDFNLLLPLIEETADRIKTNSPQTVQTGPAVRGDKATLQTHLDMLNEHPQLKELYRIFSESIAVMYGKQ